MYVPTTAGWRLAVDAGLRREPLRPPEHRQPGFAGEYDDTTILYDAFHLADSGRVMLVSPRLNNLTEPFCTAAFALDGAPAAARFLPLDRCSRTILPCPQGAETLSIAGGLGRISLAVRPDDTALFAGLRVVYTLSRNNELAWIRDWLRYYVKVHGCNAVLLYDNQSDIYSLGEIAECILAVPGIVRALVMSWPILTGRAAVRTKSGIRITANTRRWRTRAGGFCARPPG